MKANTRHFAAVVSAGLALMMPIGSARAECSNNQFLFADRNPRVPRGAISKVELEQSSEIMTMVGHEKLVKQQHTDVESAMVRALWLDLTLIRQNA
jgi:hypothetical protein